MNKMVPLIVQYSFDANTPVFLLANEEEAKAELKRQFEEEVRIELEENKRIKGVTFDYSISEDGRYAVIKNYFQDETDVTEWSIGEVEAEKPLTADYLYETLPYDVKDDLYRKIWAEHVAEDIVAQLEARSNIPELTDEELDAAIKKAAGSYVNGEYDCNQSYWANIDNIIDTYISGR